MIGPEIALEANRAWGTDAQLAALAEELAEASAAVMRYLNGKAGRHCIVEELVDVESVVASLRPFLAPERFWSAMTQRKRRKLRRYLDAHWAAAGGRTEPTPNKEAVA